MTQAALPSRPRLRLPLGRIVVMGGVAAFLAWMVLTPASLHVLAQVHPHAPRWDLLAAAPAIIRLHIAAASFAFLIGSAILIGVKGTTLHKTMGWAWVICMATTAVSSLFIKVLNPGHWSFIHFLSGWVIIALPMAVVAIKRKNVKMHRRLMTGLFVGGLVIAGAFTFVPGRLMFQVFLGCGEARPPPVAGARPAL